MQRIDRGVGIALALLGLVVFWSAQAFPNVPGQKLGAGFLPMLVGVGLAVCGVMLLRRAVVAAAQPDARRHEQAGPPLVVVGAIVVYVLAADLLGFLIVAPPMLLVVFRTLRVAWRPALVYAVLGTLVVHVAFYKLLRVPLPWGVIRPFY